MYNALNHTQFAGFNSTATFDAKGNQTNASFGQYTAGVNPQILERPPALPVVIA
jgi:hypothetical protein